MESIKPFNKNWYGMSDNAIVTELAGHVKQMRLNKNFSQAQLAKVTGLDRITISRFENGRAATLLTVVQILRALEKLEVLNEFEQLQEISPMAVAEAQEKYRKRASKIKEEKITKKKKSSW